MSIWFGRRARSCLAAFATIVPGLAQATTPPESYLLTESTTGANPIDPALKRWFETYADAVDPLTLEEKAYQTFLDGLTPAEAILMKLRASGNSPETVKPALEAARAHLADLYENPDPERLHDPVLPFLLGEVLTSPATTEEAKPPLREWLRSYGELSCPQKELLLRDINAERSLSLETARSWVERIGRYHSRRFRSESLSAILDILPTEFKEPLREALYPQVASFPKLLEDNQWLLGDKATVKTEEVKSEPWLSFELAQKQAAQRHCNTAKSHLLNGFKKASRQVGFDAAEKTALKVELCFRANGSAARMRYWRSIEEPMAKSLGFAGREIALRRRGLVFWGQDKFDEARAIFTKILKQARDEKEADIEARTIYTFARIEENAGELARAIELFEKLYAKFPDEPHREETMMALVLLNAITGKPEEAIRYADQLVERQTQLAIDERSTSVLSYALFWSARLNYQMGQTGKAKEHWRRLATEFYSTFYGALGHYMLERVSGKPFVLEPTHVARFDGNAIFGVYDTAGQRTIERVKTLLKLGMKKEAACELAELDDTSNDSGLVLAKSLLLYASGNWLEAIKKYGDLPRSFRGSLPVGMERMLFPRAYTEEVTRYSERLGIDADYIFAIIRQESVFNPRAMSAVGARGLMQLMPATARLEANHLKSDYLSASRRRELQRESLDRSSLFNAETNLALGVHHAYRLMERYKSPVFVLTAYNASPRATERWIANLASDDVLAFIERIPYAETQAYVKLVLRNYFYYKRWYKEPDAKLPHLELLARSILTPSSDETKN